MGNHSFPLSAPISDYLSEVGGREHVVMRALRESMQEHSHGKMQTAPEQALLLQFLVRLLKVERYVEIGVFTGYSLLAVALAMPDTGKIIGCDIDANFTHIAQRYWQQAKVAHKIELFIQPALKTLAKLSSLDPFDMIYIDADKENYPHYYERALSLVKQGGLIALDNMLLGRRVVHNVSVTTKSIVTIRNLNQFIHDDPRVEMMLLPIADGLTLVQKK